MSLYTIIGAGVGAVGGYFVGAPVQGAQIGAAIGGGLDASVASNSNADRTSATGAYNAQSILNTAQWNINANSAIAQFNAQLSLLGADAGADLTRAISVMNAGIRKEVGEYNFQLAEREAKLVWESLGLDIAQFDRRIALAEGQTRVKYGASGTVLDEPNDAAFDSIVELRTEAEMERTIMRHNADVQANKILDAGALGLWEAETEANRILFEGFASAGLSQVQSRMSAIAGLYQTGISNQVAYATSVNQAMEVMRGASFDSSQFRRAGTQAMVNGLFTGYSIYNNRSIPTTTPQTSVITSSAHNRSPNNSLLIN